MLKRAVITEPRPAGGPLTRRRSPGRSVTATAAAWATVVLLQPLGGCTPLGMWVYDDPSLALRSVSLRPAPDSATGVDSMDLVFAGCNRNDYDLLGAELKTSLAVHGHVVGQGQRTQPYRLITRDSTRVTVTMALQEAWADGLTSVPVEVNSEVLLKLPNRERRFALLQKGTLVLSGGLADFKGAQSGQCRSGTSTLPSEFSRPVGIDRPEAMRTPVSTPGSR